MLSGLVQHGVRPCIDPSRAGHLRWIFTTNPLRVPQTQPVPPAEIFTAVSARQALPHLSGSTDVESVPHSFRGRIAMSVSVAPGATAGRFSFQQDVVVISPKTFMSSAIACRGLELNATGRYRAYQIGYVRTWETRVAVAASLICSSGAVMTVTRAGILWIESAAIKLGQAHERIRDYMLPVEFRRTAMRGGGRRPRAYVS